MAVRRGQTTGTSAEPGASGGIAMRAAWYALVAAVALVPLATGNLTAFGVPALTNDAAFLAKTALLGTLLVVALACWSADAVLHGGVLRRAGLVDWLVLGVLGWVALATALAVHVPTALLGQYGRYDGLLAFVAYAVTYFLALQLANSSKRVRVLALALAASGSLVAAYGVAQFLGRDPFRWGALPFDAGRAFSTYGNPDLLGGFLMFSLPVCAALALSEERVWVRVALWVGFALNAACLLATFTRGAWIGGVVELVVLGLVAWRCGVRPRLLDWAAVAASAAAVLAVVARSLRSPSAVVNVGARLGTLFESSAGSGKTRAEILTSAANAVKARPLTGWGPDTFSLVYPRFELAEYVRDAGYANITDNAHSYPLHLAAGVGVPGAMLFYAVFALGGRKSSTTVFGADADSRHLVTGAFWAAAAGSLVQMLFGISTPGATFLLWLALAIVLSPTATVRGFAPVRLGARIRVASVTAIVLVAAAALGAIGSFAYADHEHLLATQAQGAAQVARAQAAVSANPLAARYRKALALAYLGEFSTAADKFDAARGKGGDTSALRAQLTARYREAAASLAAARRFAPDDFETYVFAAGLENDAGDRLGAEHYRAAEQLAREGLRLAPVAPQLHLQLGYALEGLGLDAQAAAEFGYAAKLDPAFAEPLRALAELKRKMSGSAP